MTEGLKDEMVKEGDSVMEGQDLVALGVAK